MKKTYQKPTAEIIDFEKETIMGAFDGDEGWGDMESGWE